MGEAQLEVVLEVCAHFGLGDPVAVRPAGGSRHLSLAVETARGKWLLRRRHEAYTDPRRLTFDHRVLAWLGEAGVPVAAPVADDEGHTTWQCAGGTWEAYPFVVGRPLCEGDPDDLATLAPALAAFHQAGAGFPLRLPKAGPRGETDPGRLLGEIERVRYEAPGARQALAPYRSAVVHAAARLSRQEYADLPHTLVHGDVQPANVLIADHRVAAFVDLDWCAWQPRLYDLCFALLCCALRHPEPIGQGDVWRLTQAPVLAPGAAAAFLDEYQRHASRLTRGERAALPAQLTLTWCHIRVSNALKVPPAERAGFLVRPGENPQVLLESIPCLSELP